MLKIISQKILDLLQHRNSILLIPLLTLLIYANTLVGAFQFDDITSILENGKIRNIWDIKQWWTFNSSRPVGYFTFVLNYSIHQYHVFGYHLINMLIHAINGILLYQLLSHLIKLSTPKALSTNENNFPFIAIVGALLFTAHPLCTEAVSYITQRLVSLATLFYLCSIIFYIKARTTNFTGNQNHLLSDSKQKASNKGNKICHCNKKQKMLFSFYFLLFALLAFLTKEIAYTLPITLITIELLFFIDKKSISLKKIAGIIICLIIFAGFIMLFTNWQKYLVTIPPVEGNNFSISPLQYFLTQFRVITTYIRLFFLPYGQHLDYHYPLSQHFFEIKTVVSFLFLMVIVLFALLKVRKNKILAFGLFWFFITLLPQSSIFARPNLIFEHRAYLPIIGIIIAIVGFLSQLKMNNEKFKIYLTLFFAIILIILSTLTYSRNEKWRTAYSLWRDCYIKSPEKPRVCNNMGQIMHQYKKFNAAIFYYNKALHHNPQYAEVFYNRSRVYSDMNEINKAFLDLDSAINLKPNYYSAYNNKAILCYQQKDTLQAIEIFSFVIQKNPNNADAFTNRAIIYAEKGEWEMAYHDIMQAAKIDQNNTQIKEIKNDIWKKRQQSKNLTTQ